MAAKLTRLTHKIAKQLHLVAESRIICSSRSRRPVRKLLDTPSYVYVSFTILHTALLSRLIYYRDDIIDSIFVRYFYFPVHMFVKSTKESDK
jgi:hypothetical protein